MKTQRDTQHYSYQHVKERAKERFNLTINWNDYEALNKSILDGKHRGLLKIETNGDDVQHIYRAVLKNVEVLAVWSEERQRVTTILKEKAQT